MVWNRPHREIPEGLPPSFAQHQYTKLYLHQANLQRAIPGISQCLLTHTLRQLRGDGLVTRTAHPEVPPRVEYALTGLGTTLLAAVTALIDWAEVHRDEICQSRSGFDESAKGTTS